MKLLLILLVSLGSFLTPAPAPAHELEDGLLHVYARDDNEYLGKQTLPLRADDWLWLRNRERLILGVPMPDNPPMDITLRSGAYEGVTADIAGMLSYLLHVEIAVKREFR